MNEATEILFEAVITPHRSLSPRGMRLLIFFLCGLCSVSGTVFFLLGAWPVLGFCGAEIGLAIYLLRLNAQGSRQQEILSLSADALRVRRIDTRGRSRLIVLQPMWLSLQLLETPGRVPSLILVTRGQKTEIAQALGECEKRDLAQNLADALQNWQNPVFLNPQLQG